MSETSRSGFAGLTALKLFNMAWRAEALRLIPRRTAAVSETSRSEVASQKTDRVTQAIGL
jgi:hypothetical protein